MLRDFLSFSKQMLEKLHILRMSFSGSWYREICLTVTSESTVLRHGVTGQKNSRSQIYRHKTPQTLEARPVSSNVHLFILQSEGLSLWDRR